MDSVRSEALCEDRLQPVCGRLKPAHALLVAVAAWGAAAAITSATLFPADARPGQLAGNMAARNRDSRGPLNGIEVLIVVPLLATLAARLPAPRIGAGSRPWAVIAMLVALCYCLLVR